MNNKIDEYLQIKSIKISGNKIQNKNNGKAIRFTHK